MHVQALLVYLARQDSEPQGWQPEDYGGVFPRGGTHTIKVLLPPTHKTAKVEEPRISDPEKYLITVLVIITNVVSSPITILATQVTYTYLQAH